MIYYLQKKVIRICGISVFLVFAVIFFLICIISARQLNETMDALADRILDNGGRFPEWRGGRGNQGWGMAMGISDFMTIETPCRTHFFIVQFDKNGKVEDVDVSLTFAIPEETAREFGMKTYASEREWGWIEDYRYKRYQTEYGTAIVYVDGSMNRFLLRGLLLSVGGVLVISALAILLIVIFFSKRAVRPMAESYAKQKQFITDANHELKTPLTLVMTNLDILEAEIGKNEWLEDIRSESERMSSLVNQLLVLARMDEDRTNLEKRHFSMSDMVTEVVSEFQMLAQERGKSMLAQVAPEVDFIGDEEAVRRVFSILLDNAIKYCDDGGSIVLRLEKRKHLVLSIENTYADVDKTELGKLFNRFYRADKARTFNGGFGVGLSIAKAIVAQHKGDISAYRKDESHIGFRVIWR